MRKIVLDVYDAYRDTYYITGRGPMDVYLHLKLFNICVMQVEHRYELDNKISVELPRWIFIFCNLVARSYE